MLEPPDTQTRHGQHGRYPQAASVEDFRHNLAAVRARMDAACHRAGRDPAGVRLLPVSKTKPEPSLRLAYAAGCRLLGENKAQEAFGKWEAMQDLADLRWSVIGHLQTNKASRARPWRVGPGRSAATASRRGPGWCPAPPRVPGRGQACRGPRGTPSLA